MVRVEAPAPRGNTKCGTRLQTYHAYVAFHGEPYRDVDRSFRHTCQSNALYKPFHVYIRAERYQVSDV
jgi:hypothetical protein